MDLDSSAIAGDERDANQCPESDEDINARDSGGRTLLSRAAELKTITVVKRLLRKDGINPNSKDTNGQTPLSRAVKRGREKIVELLLQQDGIDADSKDNQSRTPLSQAGECGHRGIIKMLLRHSSVNPDSKDEDSRTPLSWAAEHGHKELVKLLLKQNNVNPNSKDKDGRTPLSHAAQHGHADVILYLLIKENHINLDPKDKDGRTPLSHASEHGHEEVVKVLLEHNDINLNAKDKDGRTPLSQASRNGHIEVVNILLEQDRIDLDSKDINGQTALSQAAERGRGVVVRQLLRQGGVDPNSIDKRYRTPLWYAAEGGHKEVVKLLVTEKSVDPDLSDDDGQTPLSRATENGHIGVVGLLCQRDGITLHMQVQKGNLHLVKLLLKTRYDVNIRGTLGRTPLHTAALFGRLDIARELICSQANVNSKDVNGTTPLRLALQRKHEDLAQLLLEYSAETTGIMSEEWFNAYEKGASNAIFELSQASGGRKDVRFIEQMRARMPIEPGPVRQLLLFSDYSTWSTRLNFNLRDALHSDRSHFVHQVQIHDKCVSLFVAGYFPIGQDPGYQKPFAGNNWGKCGIAWTMVSPTRPTDGSCWKSIDHFSTLSYGWIPDNGADFFTLFVQTLKEKWLTLCELAEERLSKRRLDQLCAKGDSPNLIHHLAEDAQEWAKLRSILRGQVRAAKSFAVEYCSCYDQDNGSRVMQEAIDCFNTEVSDQISQLEQTVKDLLQFEFAWVSINEAHRSTSIATSIKRLSWITFIFLPAMFASSLFGMNVDILETNPDWRWYLLLGSGFLALTVLGWLLFKYGQIERLVERHVGKRFQRWSDYVHRSKASQQTLPISK